MTTETIDVGNLLRSELITAIDAFVREGDEAPRAAKIKATLQDAIAVRPVLFRINVTGWTYEDYDFVRTLITEVIEEDLGHTASSRGFRIGNTPIGRQLRSFKAKL